MNTSDHSQGGSGTALPAGYRLGEYAIEAILGQGGFGITYLAADTKLGSKVAIKEFFPESQVMRKGDYSLQAKNESIASYQWGLNQFLKEAQALAKFKHNNIVRVLRYLELNNTAYMVMEYEEGQNLIEFVHAQGGRLGERTLSKIFLPILNGLQAVHQAGLLHLDIKPDNIYLNKNQEPMLLDFGSVRQNSTEENMGGPLALTPAYASIEQYPNNGDQGPWTDIYSLGASMYYCVSGKRPTDSMSRYHALLKYDPDPLMPAKLLDVDGYPDFVRDCIDWALEIYPEHRPKNAAQMQDGLMGRGRPKKSGSAPNWKSKADRVRENNNLVTNSGTKEERRQIDSWKLVYWGVGGILTLAVLALAIFTIVKSNETKIDYTVASTTQQNENNNSASQSKFQDLSVEPDQILKSGAGGRKDITTEDVYVPPSKPVASLLGNLTNINTATFIPGKQLAATASEAGDIYIYGLRTGSPLYKLQGHKRAIYSISADSSGKWLAAAGDEGKIIIHNIRSKKIRMTLKKHDYSVYALAFSPDGKFLASAGKGQILLIWDLQKKRVVHTINIFRDAILSLAYSPDGETIVTGDAAGRLQYFSTTSGREISRIRANPKYVSGLTFSKDGIWVAAGGPLGELKLFNTVTGKKMPVLEGGPARIYGVQFSPNGQWIFAAGSSGYLTRWDLETNDKIRFKEHKDTIRALAISEDGRHLLTAGDDKIARVWK